MTTREELTRQAEKCLRQGRLDEAIAMYQQLAELTPVDWGVVKQLADLLERAGQREGAAAQFARWADYLFAEGFHSKAAALYKKVLKLEPNHEHALWQLGDVSLALKLRADARVAFGRVAELRQRRNDATGAAEARQRLAAIDVMGPSVPASSPLPLASVSPVASSSPAPPAESLAPVAPASPLVAPPPAPVVEPSPAEAPAARLARLRDEAMRAEVTLAPDAAQRWLAVLDAAPDDLATRLRLIRRALERHDLAEADRLAGSLDPVDDAAFAVLVEIAVAGDRRDALTSMTAARVRTGVPLPQVLAPVELLARRAPAAAGAVVAAAADAWMALGQSVQADTAFARGLVLGVLDVPACQQWVGICVAGALPTITRAQCALGDAYLATGRAADARLVAEDAWLRDTGAEPARDLLLRVLQAQGDPDPERTLHGLLSPPTTTPFEPVEPDRVDTSVRETWADISLDDDLPMVVDAVEQEAPVLPAGMWDGAAPEVQAPLVADVAPTPVLDDWLAPFVPTPSAPPAPAAMSRADFDWADLLGRDLGYGDAPPDAAPDTEPGADLSEVGLAPEPRAETQPPVLHLPEAVPEDAHDAVAVAGPAAEPESESAGHHQHVDEPQRETVPQVAAVDAQTGESGVDAPDGTASPSLLASLEQLHAQPPRVQPTAEVLPALLTPRAWLTDGPEATSASRSRHPEDDYLFADPEPTPFFARGVLRRPAPVPAEVSESIPEPAPEPPSVTDPLPVTAPVTDSPGAPAHAEGASEWIDEEIDLTQLLEELKQWDPVLPEPRSRAAAAESPVDVSSAQLAAPELPIDAAAAATLTEDESSVVDPALPQPASWPSVDIADAAPATAEPSAALLATIDEPAAPSDVEAALEAAFADLQRDDDARVVAEQQLAAGRVFLAAGLTAEAARAFERASSEPRMRFEAAQALAALHQSRGQLPEAVLWFESAAAAPVPDAAVKRPVLYDLAESLEALGESDRALGVLLDLLSQVEDYRDARVRLDRLLRVDAGG